MKTMAFRATEYGNAGEAIQYANFGGEAVTLMGRYFVAAEAEVVRLAAAGVSFAYLCDHEGRIITVPVN